MKKYNSQPLVSVVMPVYNAGDFLVDTIESIMKQTYKHFELIIINDASQDNSEKIIRKYKNRYPKKIRAIQLRNNLNRGGDSCANLGIKIAKGKYIARMDADDIAHPKRLEKQVSYLENNPHIFLVGTNAYVINGKGTIIGQKKEPLNTKEIYDSYFTFHPIIHPSCMYRKVLKDRKRFTYTIKYSANNDMYTFFKLLSDGYQFTNLKEKLLYYRIHENNSTFRNVKENFINTLKIRLNMVFKFSYHPTFKQILITLLQGFVILLLPEKIILRLYLISKGIIKIRNPFKKIKFTFKKPLSFHLSH